jgi:hypothetical protein
MFRFLDQRKQAKMQLLQDPSQTNIDNVNDVRFVASRHFWGGGGGGNFGTVKLGNLKLIVDHCTYL